MEFVLKYSCVKLYFVLRCVNIISEYCSNIAGILLLGSCLNDSHCEYATHYELLVSEDIKFLKPSAFELTRKIL